MALTYPAAFLAQNGNAAATATITASSSLTLTPASNLQTQNVGQKWRAQTDTVSLTIALAAAQSIDTIGLFGLNLTTAAVTRVRVSLTDTTAQDGAVYDSGSAAGRVSSYYGNLVALMSAFATARYIRIDLTETAIAYIQAGFLMIGLRNQVGINFAWGSQDIANDASIKTKARSQSVWIDSRAKSRTWSLPFDTLNAVERQGWVEDMLQSCGQSQNIMIIRDCSSTNLGRDTLCGLLTKPTPVATKEGFINGDITYAMAVELEQRV